MFATKSNARHLAVLKSSYCVKSRGQIRGETVPALTYIVKTHVERVIFNFTVICSSAQHVHFEKSLPDCVAELFPLWALKVHLFWGCAISVHVSLTKLIGYNATNVNGTEELNKAEETGKGKTKKVHDYFIIQMNDNHMHASRQGCASVSKWTHQLCAEAEGRQGPLCGDNLQPSKRLLIPFGGKTSEGSLVRCQLTFFLWPLTSAAARESGRWLICQRRKRELVKQRACAFSDITSLYLVWIFLTIAFGWMSF